MIKSSKLIQLARKWQKIAVLRRKTISFPKISISSSRNADSWDSPLAEIGNFVIYTIDDHRFVIPLAYLSHQIFVELFKLSEEAFGLPSEGPIKFPCDSVFMEYIISLVIKGLAKDIEKALLTFIETSCRFHQECSTTQHLVCCY
ncbi:auxin-responsive protein SAUR68-like [Euphorbia lathyris]|uniref:auxin-responsive protein SAUR68-like n=1 Tax=Euphorbia lathyris TaxID=212925 RepID=UPI003313F047